VYSTIEMSRCMVFYGAKPCVIVVVYYSFKFIRLIAWHKKKLVAGETATSQTRLQHRPTSFVSMKLPACPVDYHSLQEYVLNQCGTERREITA